MRSWFKDLGQGHWGLSTASSCSDGAKCIIQHGMAAGCGWRWRGGEGLTLLTWGVGRTLGRGWWPALSAWQH